MFKTITIKQSVHNIPIVPILIETILKFQQIVTTDLADTLIKANSTPTNTFNLWLLIISFLFIGFGLFIYSKKCFNDKPSSAMSIFILSAKSSDYFILFSIYSTLKALIVRDSKLFMVSLFVCGLFFIFYLSIILASYEVVRLTNGKRILIDITFPIQIFQTIIHFIVYFACIFGCFFLFISYLSK